MKRLTALFSMLALVFSSATTIVSCVHKKDRAPATAIDSTDYEQIHNENLKLKKRIKEEQL